MPFEKGSEPRIALEALILLPSGDTVRVVCAHFALKPESLPVAQATYINQLFQDEIPTILAGDLNVTPDSETINLLRQDWTESLNSESLTFPSSEPSIKIDYILTQPKLNWKVIESFVINEKKSSDHFPIIAKLELLPNK